MACPVYPGSTWFGFATGGRDRFMPGMDRHYLWLKFKGGSKNSRNDGTPDWMNLQIPPPE